MIIVMYSNDNSNMISDTTLLPSRVPEVSVGSLDESRIIVRWSLGGLEHGSELFCSKPRPWNPEYENRKDENIYIFSGVFQ